MDFKYKCRGTYRGSTIVEKRNDKLYILCACFWNGVNKVTVYEASNIYWSNTTTNYFDTNASKYRSFDSCLL